MNDATILSIFPTVDELLALPAFHGCRILAGKAGTGRIVSGTNLSDNPDYLRWLSKNEILITTCYGIHDRPEALQSFISDVDAKHLAAIFIKKEPYLGEIPDFMIRDSERTGLPLISLPKETRMADLVAAVYAEISKKQSAALRQSLFINKMLLSTVLDGAGLDEIAERLSDVTGRTILIVDMVNNLQGMKISQADLPDFENMDTDAEIQKISECTNAIPLKDKDSCLGYLYYYKGNDDRLLSPDILSQFNSIVCLEISRNQLVNAGMRTELSSFLLHLLSDQLLDEKWEIARAENLGLRNEDVYTIMRMQVSGSTTQQGMSASIRTVTLLGSIRRFFREYGFTVQFLEASGEYIILLSTSVDNPELLKFNQHIEEFHAEMDHYYSSLNPTIGCGNPISGINGLIRSSQEALVCQKAAVNIGNSLCFFGTLGLLRLIYSDHPVFEINRYINETLGPILYLEKSRKSELLDTLQNYIRYDGNVRKISSEMYMHYNTVSYRLKTIEELTGRDLHNSDDRFTLQLALKLLHLTNSVPLPDRPKATMSMPSYANYYPVEKDRVPKKK